MSSNEVERPEWIQPGAEVVVWSRGTDAKTVKIKSVGKVWITLDGDYPRIEIKTLKSARQGGTWDSWHAYIAERNSPEGIRQLNRTYVGECIRRARIAYKDWDNKQTSQVLIANVAKAMSDLNDAIVLMKENS